MEFEKVQEIIARILRFSKDQIKPETRFIEDLGADSLDIYSLIIEIENTFDIAIDDDEIEKISTVGDVVEYIKNIDRQ